MIKRGKKKVDNNNIETIIGQHANFTGELEFEGAVRIDGHFEGNIRARNGAILIVSEVAEIIGEVNVPNLVLHGVIRGNVCASESLKITATGKLTGDVEYHVISLSEGAAVNGRCNRIDEKKQQPEAVAAKPAKGMDAKLTQAA